MPFLDTRNDQLPPLRPGMASQGISTGVVQNFTQVFSHQYRVNSQLAFEAEMNNRYQANLDKFKELTGEDPGISAGWSHMQDYYNRRKQVGRIDPRYNTDAQLMQQFDERIKALQEQFPDLKTFDELVSDVGTMFKDVDEETDRVSSLATFPGAVGGFLGGMAGSFTFRDPLLLGTMFISPGTGPVRRVLSEMAIGAAAETFTQYGVVQPRRAEFDLPEQSALQSIIFAGVGSGLIRGGLDAAPLGFRAAERQLFPERAQARIFRDTMDEALSAPLRDIMQRMTPERLSDERLMEIAKQLNQTPTVRAAMQGLQEGMDFARANPYGEGRVAEMQFSRDLTRTALEFDGEIVPDFLRTDTAVGRFIDGELTALSKTPESTVGRLDRPDLYTRVDEAQARVEEIDARISELEEAVSSRTMADTVGLLDEVSGARVREIEAELDGVIPRPRREALEAELDTIVENLGPNALAKAESDLRIGPKKAIADARRARRSALKELRKAQRPVDAYEARLRKQGEELQTIDAILNPEKIQRQAVRELHEEVKEADPRIPEVTENLVRGVKEATDGFVDLNTGERIPDDFVIHLGPDDTNVSTVKAIMDDLAEDTNLLEAMRSCAI